MAETKGKATAENTELAFKVFHETGGNIAKTTRVLNSQYGFRVSERTLSDWVKTLHFRERMADADARLLQRERQAAEVTVELLNGMIDHLGQYRAYFNTLTVAEVDPKATRAMTSLVRTIMELLKINTKPDLGQIDDFQRLAKEAVAAIYGVGADEGKTGG